MEQNHSTAPTLRKSWRNINVKKRIDVLAPKWKRRANLLEYLRARNSPR